jgi:hypothetical protein
MGAPGWRRVAESLLAYVGLVVALGGVGAILASPHGAGPIGAVSLALGVALLALGLFWPARSSTIGTPTTLLDRQVPEWEFREVHEVLIEAPAGVVYRALREVRAADVVFFRTLTWIRSPRWPWSKPEPSLLAPGHGALLDVALRSGFLLLDEEAPTEIVVGAIVAGPARAGIGGAEFASLSRPGYAKAAMNFRTLDEGGGWTRLRTETRVRGTDAAARRRFGVYWRIILPGSSLIRWGWLRAVKVAASGMRRENPAAGG